MSSNDNLQDSFNKNINEITEAFNQISTKNSELNDELKKYVDMYTKLKKDYDENILILEEENATLNFKVKEYEANFKKAILIEFKINEFLKSITESKAISGEATKALIEIFVRLIDEELKVILKLADSFAIRKEKKHIDKESLNQGLKSLISSDRLLKKALELVQNLYF